MTLLYFSMVVVVYILLSFINIPEKEENEDPPRQGNLIIQISWPHEMDSDVDLWVRSSADMVPVGYSNKGGPLFNLLRDDLGDLADLTGKNEEETVSRGIPDGEYIVNAHLFNLKGGRLPIPVKLFVFLKNPVQANGKTWENASAKLIFTVEGSLKFSGQELTMARFKLKDGQYVPESFNTRSISIRSISGSDHL